MRVAEVALYCAEWMLHYRLPSFVVLRILFDVVIIYVYSILVFAALYNALRKLGTVGS
jgi:hypothetical protein